MHTTSAVAREVAFLGIRKGNDCAGLVVILGVLATVGCLLPLPLARHSDLGHRPLNGVKVAITMPAMHAGKESHADKPTRTCSRA